MWSGGMERQALLRRLEHAMRRQNSGFVSEVLGLFSLAEEGSSILSLHDLLLLFSLLTDVSFLMGG